MNPGHQVDCGEDRGVDLWDRSRNMENEEENMVVEN